jgi:hypothetical protein
VCERCVECWLVLVSSSTLVLDDGYYDGLYTSLKRRNDALHSLETTM